MVSLFFVFLLAFGLPAHTPASTVPAAALASVVQTQQPAPLEQGDDNAYKPYEGFNILAYSMIAITLLIIGFVVVRVFRRMNQSRKQEGESQQTRKDIHLKERMRR